VTLSAALLSVLALLPSVAAPVSSETPFELVDNRVIIPVTIDGTTGFRMVFDTGSTGILVTPEAARRLHLAVKGAGSITGAGAGSASISSTHLAAVTIAGIELGATPAIVADLGPIRRAIGFSGLDGIVGSDVLKRYAIEVNADRQTFALYSGAYAAPPQAQRVPYSLRSGFITLPAQIDSIAGSVLLDTGDRSSLTLFEPFARDHGFYSVLPSVHGAVTGYGIGGKIESNVLRTQLSAFGYTVDGVLTRAPIGAAGAFDSQAWAGSIGNGFMLRFNVIYDQPQQTLVLWPSATFAMRERYDPVGMWVASGELGPLVTSVLAGGPADQSGVRTGDTILAVDGISTRTWLPPRLRAWLAAQPNGATVKILLQMQSGGRVVRSVSIRQLV
jgi:hypothetical protein